MSLELIVPCSSGPLTEIWDITKILGEVGFDGQKLTYIIFYMHKNQNRASLYIRPGNLIFSNTISSFIIFSCGGISPSRKVRHNKGR